MTLTWKDTAATVVTGFVALVYFASRESWNVALVGGSHRWAAVVIFVLGAVTCGLGRQTSRMPMMFWILGTAAVALGVLAVATGSLTALSFLTLDIVVLWAAATLRHITHVPGKPVTH